MALSLKFVIYILKISIRSKNDLFIKITIFALMSKQKRRLFHKKLNKIKKTIML